MRTAQRTVWIAVLGIAVVAGIGACGDAAPKLYRGHGIVKSVDADARKVTLDHEDIPGLMEAMTMTFDVASAVTLAGIEPGDEVDFQLTEENGRFVVAEIRRAER